MRTAEFDYDLPPELIAQHPLEQRDASRLLVISRDSGRVEHRKFPDLLGFLRKGDVLVLNNSRVIPARLRGVNAKTGGAFEVVLLEELGVNDWWAMLRPGKRARVGTGIKLTGRDQGIATRSDIQNPKSKTQNPCAPIRIHAFPITATVVEVNAEGHRRLRFAGVDNILDALELIGEVPLPPYIRREQVAPALGDSMADDRERYQTVFAHPSGSVAAPTAGLHFTEALLDEIRARGVQVCFVTLHVGLGTFAPVKAETLDAHVMHEERYEISDLTAHSVNTAKAEGRRVIAVGTTSVRVLESAAQPDGTPIIDPARSRIVAGSGRTKIFIHPPHRFKIVDAMLTNFHLPCSTLLMLVSAFATPGETRGRELILSAYTEAIRERYRFFSYGDAMLIA